MDIDGGVVAGIGKLADHHNSNDIFINVLDDSVFSIDFRNQYLRYFLIYNKTEQLQQDNIIFAPLK